MTTPGAHSTSTISGLIATTRGVSTLGAHAYANDVDPVELLDDIARGWAAARPDPSNNRGTETHRMLTIWVHTEELWRELETAAGLSRFELGRFKEWAALDPRHFDSGRYDLDAMIGWAHAHGIPYTEERAVHYRGTTGVVEPTAEQLTLNGDRFEPYREHVQTFQRAAPARPEPTTGSERARPHIDAGSDPAPRPLPETEAKTALSRLEALVDRLGISSEDADELVYDLFHAGASEQVNNGELPESDFTEAHDALHDRADDQASDINQGGVRDQLAALLGAYGEQDLVAKLYDTVGVSAPHAPVNTGDKEERCAGCERGEPVATQLDNDLMVAVFRHGHLRVYHPYTGDERRIEVTSERGNVTVSRLP